jgi:hypothetical protein
MSDTSVEQINTGMEDTAPVMPSPFSGVVQLLRGLHDEHGWHDTALVRELNGADEEFLAELGSKDSVSYTEYVTGVLTRGVVTIGTLPSKGLTQKLILADRNVLFHAILRMTYGDDKHVLITCPACSKESEIILELEKDFPIFGMGTDLRPPLKVDLRNGEVEVRYPTGEDVAYAVANSHNTPEMNTMVIARTIVATDDTTFDQKVEMARELNIPDRRAIEKAIENSTSHLGPQLGEVDTRCVHCEANMPVLMDWVSLLLG